MKRAALPGELGGVREIQECFLVDFTAIKCTVPFSLSGIRGHLSMPDTSSLCPFFVAALYSMVHGYCC